MWTSNALTRLFGLKAPIIQGPFGGGLSTTALAAAVSNAGGLGSFGAHALAPAQIRDVVKELRGLTPNAFSINLWVPLPNEPTTIAPDDYDRAVARLRPHFKRFELPDPPLPQAFSQSFTAQAEALLDERPPAMSFVMGVPPKELLAEARARGILTLGTATTVDEAVALEAAGVDVVVASGSDAGGHRGAFLRPAEESLVGTFSLIPQVADAVRLPVVAAGGIADGRGIAAALALGASGVQVGTAFLMSHESAASAAHRAALASPRARATVLTRAYTGRHARGIPNALYQALAPDAATVPDYPIQNWLTTPLRRAASSHDDGEYQSLWSGQSAPLARARAARETFDELVAGTTKALERLKTS